MRAVFSRLSRLSGGFRTSTTKRRRASHLHRVGPARPDAARDGFHLADWRTCLRIGTDAAWVTDQGQARGARQPAGTRPELRGRSRFAWLRDLPESPAPANLVALLDRLDWVRAQNRARLR
jgi:hypothetical protein